jgi:hypothetical protein
MKTKELDDGGVEAVAGAGGTVMRLSSLICPLLPREKVVAF